MDRRSFLQIGAGAVAATSLGGIATALPAVPAVTGHIMKDTVHIKRGSEGIGPLKVRFLGTGAADWNGRDDRGELRRLSSVLLEDRILIESEAPFMTPARFSKRRNKPEYLPETAMAIAAIRCRHAREGFQSRSHFLHPLPQGPL